MRLIPFLWLFLSIPIHAGIYGNDPREEITDAPAHWQQLARASVALIPKTRLIQKNNYFTINASPLVDAVKLCPDQNFSQQPLLANCSGALIDKDLVLTAAHCISENPKDPFFCENYYYVFDYDHLTTTLRDDQVYECQQIKHYELNIFAAKDLAVIKLNRKIEDRAPVSLSREKVEKNTPVTMIGYPMGIPMKIVPQGQIEKAEKSQFLHHQTTFFSVNSGSPIFNSETMELIGVLSSGHGFNFSNDASGCNNWYHHNKENEFALSVPVSQSWLEEII